MAVLIRLIDVGARGGIDKRWKPYHALMEVVAFEPDPKECAILNSRRYPYSIRFLPVALGADDGRQATLFVARQPGCSSLLRPNVDLCRRFRYGVSMETVGEVSISVTRLDTACADFHPDVMKVDTQGTELDVLQGAGRLLDDALAVELEVEFIPQYVGQALFADIDAFMRHKGFTLRGLRRTYWREEATYVHPYGGQILHGDALYLRRERMDCDKGHVILAAYRQYDLLARFGASHLIPRVPPVVGLASRVFSGFSNKQLRRFVDRLCDKSVTDWHDPDFF